MGPVPANVDAGTGMPGRDAAPLGGARWRGNDGPKLALRCTQNGNA